MISNNFSFGPNKAVFLDRDGVLNREIGTYVWQPEKFEVLPGVPAALQQLKAAGYYLVVVTNQAGIAKQLYLADDVKACHAKLQAACGGAIDALYFAPGYPAVSESLRRKPNSLMLEQAMARFHLNASQCWVVGDRLRDMEAGARVGVPGILVGEDELLPFPLRLPDLPAAAAYILSQPF